MNTIQSAKFTLFAVFRKGVKDVIVTINFFTDEEMIKLYQTLWQSMYGLAMLMYGLGVLTRRQVDALVEASLKPAEEQPAEEQPAAEEPAEEQPAAEEPAEEQPAAEEPAAGFSMEEYVSDWKTGIIPVLLENFQNFTNKEKAHVLSTLGLPYRVNNRRFNSEEMLEIYREHLYSL